MSHITGRLELFRFFWPEAGCIRTVRQIAYCLKQTRRERRAVCKIYFPYTEKSPIRNCRTGLPCEFSFYRAAIFSVSLPCAANIFLPLHSRFCGKWSVAPAGQPGAQVCLPSWCPNPPHAWHRNCCRKVHNLAF